MNAIGAHNIFKILLLPWLSTYGVEGHNHMTSNVSYILDGADGSRLAVLHWKGRTRIAKYIRECSLYGDRNIIKLLLEGSDETLIHRVQNFDYWQEACEKLSSVMFAKHWPLLKMNQDINATNNIFASLFIIPGTKWCGVGNIAKDYDDLGREKETDVCCREHDHCQEYIGPGETKYGLTNGGIFLRSHCNCDENFRKCLLSTRTRSSDCIGHWYFNFLHPKCLKLSPPITCCSTYETWGLIRTCVNYVLDSSKPSTWQFFENPFYNTSRTL